MSFRIVLDSSVMVPALFHPTSAGRKVLQHVVRACWEIVLSPDLIREYERALRRKGRRGRSLLPRLTDLKATPGKTSAVAPSPKGPADYPTSPKDHHVLAAAEDGRAQMPVHENHKDFERPAVKERMRSVGVEVLDAGGAADRLEKERERFRPSDRLRWLFAKPP